MANTNTSNHFKKYEREPRLQTVDNRFITGMVFNETPLMAGSVKELVNFDIDGVSGSLKPRPSLRAKSFTQTRNRGYTVDKTLIEECIIVDSAVKTESDGVKYGLVMVGHPYGTDAGEYARDRGDMFPITVPHYSKVESAIGMTELYEDGINRIPFPIYPGYEGAYAADCRFIRPKEISIHDLQTDVDTLRNISKPVGCFAFNGDYYTIGGINPDDWPEYKQGILHTKFGNYDYTDKDTGVVSKANYYKFQYVEPKKLTPKEAVTWGYNMVSDNPYDFTCGIHSSAVTITGVLPYVDGTLCMSPLMNQSLNIKVFYTMPSGVSYKFVAEYKELGGSEFIKIGDKKYTVPSTNPQPIEFPFSASAQEIILRVRVVEERTVTKPPITEGGEPTTEIVDFDIATMAVGFNFNKEDYGNTANIKPVKYHFENAKGMTYWQNRLVIYNTGGTENGANMLFMSDINDPSYFPYPQGADIFDEPIIHATPFLDDLLVFTNSRLYLISLAEDGTYYTKKCIQNNLNINDWDIHLIQVVKNMVFFKSGNYYYMVVPKANSMTGELVIAPISKNIKPLLDNFKQNVENTLQIVYNYNYSGNGLNLVHYYNYLDFEDVHNIYVFKTASGDFINYVLLYNTMSRTWRTYVYTSSKFIEQYMKDATKRGSYLSCHYNANNIGGEYTGVMLQFMHYADNTTHISDLIYTDDKTTNTVITNKQALDTGYRDLNSNYKKRFREFQMQVHNPSPQQVLFNTMYMLDNTIQHTFSNELYQTIGTGFNEGALVISPNTGLDTQLGLNTPIPDYMSKHAEDYWILGSPSAPQSQLWKIRAPIMGKGYTPKLYIIVDAKEYYELLNITWVYRTLYSR